MPEADGDEGRMCGHGGDVPYAGLSGGSTVRSIRRSVVGVKALIAPRISVTGLHVQRPARAAVPWMRVARRARARV